MANRIFRELKIKVEMKICRTRDYSCSESYMLSFMYSKSPSIVVSWVGSVDELIDAKWNIREIEHRGFLCDKMYRIEKL